MNKDFETVIPFSAVDEGKLGQLVGQLASVTGQPIQIQHQFVLRTPDAGVAVMLDSLRESIKGANGNGHAKLAVRKISKAAKSGAAGTMGGASWKVEATGEIYSTRAVHQHLAARDGVFAKGATLINVKGERAVILPDDAGDLQLIKEPKA